MEMLYRDDRVIVCIKPVGVLSTDEPGGLPELARHALGEPQANLRTVHRLDRVVGGLILLAETARAASDLSAQIRSGAFEKEYLALCHGVCPEKGVMEDELFRDKARHKTMVAPRAGRETQTARLEYERVGIAGDLSLVRIRLQTGRTHQIRAQFSARGFTLAGDRKYGAVDAFGDVGLWSWRISFLHPRTGCRMTACKPPAPTGVWETAGSILSEFPTIIPDPNLGKIR